MRQPPKRLKTSFLLAVLVSYFGSLIVLHNRLGAKEGRTRTLRPRPCAFAELYSAFPPRKSKSSKSSTTYSNETCWKLADEIVRIPVDALQTPLEPIAHGSLGGVYRSIVTPLHCEVAVKTDLCQSSPWWWIWRAKKLSCLEAGISASPSYTYMGAEYTGALVWYAQHRTGRMVPGLLPTWAIVEASPSTTAAAVGRFPHPDPHIQGVIMPIIEGGIKTVADVLQANNQHYLPRTASQLAQTMIPAARGLAFVGSLGLAFRDLLEKNVGILSNGDGIVYDHSYMGWQHISHCSSEECLFCPEEDVFPRFDDPYHRVVKGIPAGHPYILGDLHNFRNVLVKLLAKDDPLAHQLLQTQNVQHLIQVLELYV